MPIAEVPGFESVLTKRLADRYKRSEAEISQLVSRWMEVKPLPFLKACRFPGVESVFSRLRQAGKRIGVLSDYPAHDKLAALGLEADLVVSARDKEVDILKPHPSGLLRIMKLAEVEAGETVMIGDRAERDGEIGRRSRCPDPSAQRQAAPRLDLLQSLFGNLRRDALGRARRRGFDQGLWMHHLLDVLFKIVGRYETLSAALAVVASLVFLVLPARLRTIVSAMENAFCRLAERPVLSSLFLIGILVGGRLLLIPLMGLPQPIIADEFSLMLQADTYAHGRLTNPYTSLPPSFSQIYGLISPTYASMYPVLKSAPGAMAEALGLHPWFGILFTMSILVVVIYFLIRRIVPPGYALLMASLVILRFGYFSGETNSYGATPTIPLGGALLVLGYLEFEDKPSIRSGLFVGLGVFLIMTAHPFQALVFAGPILLALAYKSVRRLTNDFTPVALAGVTASIVIFAGLGLTAAHNQAVTGSWSKFPLDLYRTQYGLTSVFMNGPEPSKPVISVDYAVINKYHVMEGEDYEKERTLRGVVRAEVSRYRRAAVFIVGLPLLLPFVLGFGFFRRRVALLAAAVTLLIGVGFITWGHATYAISVLGTGVLRDRTRISTLALSHHKGRSPWDRRVPRFGCRDNCEPWISDVGAGVR